MRNVCIEEWVIEGERKQWERKVRKRKKGC
jgi:hypothetical protein